MSNKNPAVEQFPFAEIASATDAGVEAFRDQSAVLQAAGLIRQMREDAGLTQRELAKRVGTTQPHLSELERGTGSQGPTFLMLQRIAKACGTALRIEATREQAATKEKLALIDDEIRQVLADALDSLPTTLALSNHIADISKNFEVKYVDWLLRQSPKEMSGQVWAMGCLVDKLPEMKIAASDYQESPYVSSGVTYGPPQFFFRKTSPA
jgi:transcriptional regulator with XRE-family HTH domain